MANTTSSWLEAQISQTWATRPRKDLNDHREGVDRIHTIKGLGAERFTIKCTYTTLASAYRTAFSYGNHELSGMLLETPALRFVTFASELPYQITCGVASVQNND